MPPSGHLEWSVKSLSDQQSPSSGPANTLQIVPDRSTFPPLNSDNKTMNGKIKDLDRNQERSVLPSGTGWPRCVRDSPRRVLRAAGRSHTRTRRRWMSGSVRPSGSEAPRRTEPGTDRTKSCSPALPFYRSPAKQLTRLEMNTAHAHGDLSCFNLTPAAYVVFYLYTNKRFIFA